MLVFAVGGVQRLGVGSDGLAGRVGTGRFGGRGAAQHRPTFQLAPAGTAIGLEVRSKPSGADLDPPRLREVASVCCWWVFCFFVFCF
jgi:hypothetical protein